MPVKVRCRECKSVLNAPDAARGKALKCPKCESRVRVPAADGAGSEGGGAKKGSGGKARRKRPQRSKGGGLAELDLRRVEDRDTRICPKCATKVTEDDVECPNCGVNIDTGVLSEAQRIARTRKGPDPAKFYGEAWSNSWAFLKKNKGLAVRTAVVWMVASTISASAFYALNWSVNGEMAAMREEAGLLSEVEIVNGSVQIRGGEEGEVVEFRAKRYKGDVNLGPMMQLALSRPPAMFWMFMGTVFFLAVPGWYWLLGLQVVDVTMKGKDNIKRLQADLFGNISLGLKSVFWPFFIVWPLLAIPAAIYFFAESQTGAIVAAGLLLGYSLLLLPSAMIHMNQSYTYPAWLLVNMTRDFFRVVPATLYFLLVAFCVLIPALGLAGGAAAASGQIRTRFNNSMTQAVQWCQDNITAFEGPTGQFLFYEWPIFILLMLLVAFVAALLTAASALFIMRANGLFGLYFRDKLSLLNETFAGTPVGFGPRYLAFLVDLLMVPFTPFLIVKNGTATMVAWFAVAAVGLTYFTSGQQTALLIAGAGVLPTFFLMYFGLLESGYEQCTVGKNGLGLLVADAECNRMKTKPCMVRAFGKIVSILCCGAGGFMAAMPPKHLALHDKMAKSQVVWRGDET